MVGDRGTRPLPRARSDYLALGRPLHNSQQYDVRDRVQGKERRVVGLFTDDDLLRGLFPAYLRELHHTAFVREESDALAARIEEASGEPVERYMRAPITVDVGASALHVAERFLHSPWGALAVVESDRFVGMVDEVDFVEALMRQLGFARAEGSSPR